MSMEDAIDQMMRVAQCDWGDARGLLVQAIIDGAIGCRFGDDGLQEIKPFLWAHARQYAPFKVHITGDASHLRRFFGPPPDPALLPERPRPIEVRRADLEKYWRAVAADRKPGAGHPVASKTRRRDEKRPDIIRAIEALAGSPEWEQASGKARCRLVERHLDQPPGWCSTRTLVRAMPQPK
jgi:hypothetical protein